MITAVTKPSHTRALTFTVLSAQALPGVAARKIHTHRRKSDAAYFASLWVDSEQTSGRTHMKRNRAEFDGI